ncbi:YncE family protein [Effusibacillus consociatus]|uniref:YncE family protein n=1 Tax=Effusibacillus consociatus TaxID=1117041 RepID=A0ABV9Q1K9_9BACL
MLNKKFLVSVTLLMMTACSNMSNNPLPNTLNENNVLYISDGHNLQEIDVDTNDQKVIKNTIFIQSLNYDKDKKKIVAPGYSPGDFWGLLYVEGTDLKKQSTLPFSPIHLYQFGTKYVMDSAQALNDGKIHTTQVGLYDSNSDRMIKLFQVPGIVKDIAGYESKAYISSYHSQENAQFAGVSPKSNIYELDLNSNELRPIFKNDQKWVPFKLLFQDGYLYGVYQSGRNVPKDATQNILAKINPKTGTIEKTVQLSKFAKDLVLSTDGKSIFVTHFDEWGSQETIQNPLSKIDLSTFQVDVLSDNLRAASIVSNENKLYVGSDLDGKITVVDEKTFKVEKTINTKIPAMYITKNK